MPDVSIIIPAWNQWAYTARCLTALAANPNLRPQAGHGTATKSLEVILVDDGSRDETATRLAAWSAPPWPRVVSMRENSGFARACNAGAAQAQGRYLLFLNNDTEPEGDFTSELIEALEATDRAAIAGGRMLFPDGRVQHAGFELSYGTPYPVTVVPMEYGRLPEPDKAATRTVAAVSGACLLVRALDFQRLSGFDESFLNGYEDVDLCLRAGIAGKRVVLASRTRIVHHEAVSGGRFAHEAENLERFQKRWANAPVPFRFDFRPARPWPTLTNRSPLSLIVIADRALPTIVPCAENALRALSHSDDQMLLLPAPADDASAAACAQLAHAHGRRARVLAETGTLQERLSAALAAVERPLTAIIFGNTRLGLGTLDKLVRELEGSTAPFIAARPGGPRSSVPDLAPSPAALPLSARPVDLTTAPPGCLLARTADWLRPPSAITDSDFIRPLFTVPKHSDRRSPPQNTDSDLRITVSDADVVLGSVAVGRLDAVASEGAPESEAERELAVLQARRHLRPPALTSVIMLVYDNLAFTQDAVRSLFRHTHLPFELLLVDNGSAHEAATWMDELATTRANVTVIRNRRNEGFAYGCNQGLAQARGGVLVLLNNDVVLTAGWLEGLLSRLQADPHLGIVAPTTNATSGAQLVAVNRYPGLPHLDDFAAIWAREHAGETPSAHRLVALAYAMPRRLIDTIGGFDTLFGYGNFEDDDFCVRAQRAGFGLAIAADVFVHHHGSATFRQMALDPASAVARNWELFCAKWQHDPRARSSRALATLARAAPFDASRDHIPLQLADAFSPSGPAVALETTKPERVLCFPDFDADNWRPALTHAYAAEAARGAASARAFVIRLDAATPERLDTAITALRTLEAAHPTSPSDSPDILVDAGPWPAAGRAALYRACTAYLPCGERRQPFHEREARACGLRILSETAASR